MRRVAVNFRFTEHTLEMLSLLETMLHLTKTAVIEEAISTLTKEKMSQKNTLMQFAGMLSTEEAETMLKTIKKNRRNKKIPVWKNA